MQGCHTTRSPPRPGSHAARWGRRWRARAAAWWRRSPWESGMSISHVDDGQLHAYLDGELPQAEAWRLEAHLGECPACRGRLEEQRALIARAGELLADRKSTRLNSSHVRISYAVFCLKKKKTTKQRFY